MKILKIESKVAKYTTDEKNYNNVETINAGDILKILNIVMEHDIEYDDLISKESDPSVIANPAQWIIYNNLLIKIKSLIEQKSSIKEEVDILFKDAYDKYKLDE